MAEQSFEGERIVNINTISIIDMRQLYEWLNLMDKVEKNHAVYKFSKRGNSVILAVMGIFRKVTSCRENSICLGKAELPMMSGWQKSAAT